MEIFNRFFHKKRKTEESTAINLQTENSSSKTSDSQHYYQEVNKLPDWAEPEITDEEKELVAIIATAGLANSMPHKKFRVKRILKVDPDWKVAGLAATIGLSEGKPYEKYRIKSIKRIK